jgi:hypothetical protein
MGQRSSTKATTGSVAPPIDLASGATTRWTLDDARLNGPVVLVFLRGFF